MRIDLHRLTKRYGKLPAVDNVSLSIADGELYTLLGPSGCGKSTLLRLVAGFIEADEGEIRFDERVVTPVPAHERGIGMVFQNYALWPHMTVFDNVAYGLRLRDTKADALRERVGAMLERVKLGGLDQRYPGQLSGGQQQRVALARALVLNPRILLLDEPLSNLDAKIRVQVRAEIRTLQQSLGITTLYVTHDQEEALTMSDRIAVIEHGQIRQVGTPRDLYERPASRFVADFIGTNNLLEGTIEAFASTDAGARPARVKTAIGTLSAIADERLASGVACAVGVRPEHIRIGGPDATTAAANRILGRIAFVAYLGHSLRYDVDVGHGTVIKVDVGSASSGSAFEAGASVALEFSADSARAVPLEAVGA